MKSFLYESAIGNLIVRADEIGLMEVSFRDKEAVSEEELHTGECNGQVPEDVILAQAKAWLDTYFSGKDPGAIPPIHLIGTDFQKKVWEVLCRIPYGQTTTYGAVAKEVASMMGKEKMSAQAVGGAVGKNPVDIMVPCHRVIGSDGSMVGYSDGLEYKIALLELENVRKGNR